MAKLTCAAFKIFATAVATGNAIFRIPTPIFGAGLIEAIEDAAILANKTANAAAKQRVKAIFVFQRIADKEGTRVDQTDMARRLQEMSAQYKIPFDKLVKDLEKAGRMTDIYNQLLTDKVVDLLVQYAKIHDVTPAPPM